MERKKRNQSLFYGTLIFFILIISVMAIANWSALFQIASYEISPSSFTRQENVSSTIYTTDGIRVNKLGIDAPIIWNIPIEKTDSNLSSGIVHTEGTALPGKIGTMVLTGHSSDYPWKKHPYKSVFSLVYKLQQGDLITVTKDGTDYSYKVTDSRVVSANDRSILSQDTTSAHLTLMTCYPIGTTWKRLVVHAKLINEI